MAPPERQRQCSSKMNSFSNESARNGRENESPQDEHVYIGPIFLRILSEFSQNIPRIF